MKALIKFITEEWYFFLPMLFLSLVAAALVVWRWLLNVNARTNLESFLPGVPGASCRRKGSRGR